MTTYKCDDDVTIQAFFFSLNGYDFFSFLLSFLKQLVRGKSVRVNKPTTKKNYFVFRPLNLYRYIYF